MEEQITILSRRVGQYLRARNYTLTTAESCTGGMIAAAITDIPGSSQWFHEGLVTYANSSKSRRLMVSAGDIEKYGAVSAQVVESMAQGASHETGVAVATSGIAGPDGGSKVNPVGTVWFAWSVAGQISSEKQLFSGSRQSIREQAVIFALKKLISKLESN